MIVLDTDGVGMVSYIAMAYDFRVILYLDVQLNLSLD